MRAPAKWRACAVTTPRFRRAAGHQLLLGELPDRLQHRKPCPPSRPCRPPAATCAPTRRARSRTASSPLSESPYPATAQALSRSNPPANTEHRCQQRLLGVIEQVIRPRHRMAQRLVACPTRAATRPAASEPPIKTIPHLAGSHRRHPRRGQLDSQRNPIQALTNSRRPRPPHSPSTIEKPGAMPCARSTNRLTARRADSRGRVQRAHWAHLLRGDVRVLHGWWPCTLTGCRTHEGGLDPHRRRRRARCSQLSTTNSRTLALQRSRPPTPMNSSCPARSGDAQHGGHRVGHRRRIGDRCQLEKPNPVRELIAQLARRPPNCEARLANSHQPRSASPAGEPSPPLRSRRASDSRPIKLVAAGRTLARRRIQRPQRRKVRAKADVART